MVITLEVKERGAEAPDALRAAGLVPAVSYGPKDAPQSLAIDARTLESVWRQAGQTSIVRLAGAGEEKDALFRDVQVHPVSGAILHVDFYIPEKGKKVEVEVPLDFAGEAPAEKAGHVLVKALHSITIEVAPAELPHSLAVDVSALENVGDRVLAGDIKLPPSGALVTDAEEIVVSVTEQEAEPAEEAAPAPEAPAAPAPDAQ